MSDRSVTRVRHEVRRRLLDVIETTHVTPHLVRITLGGEQLAGFTSLGFDDHVKVIVPSDWEACDSLPPLDPEGLVAEVPEPVMRDYTPHHFDPAALTLQVDFALHDGGPATAWARRAKRGDKLLIGGPRSSFVVGTGFDWHMLVGDGTALPAIRRRLAELPAGSRAVVLAEVDGPKDEEPFESRADVDAHWIHRSHADRSGMPSLLAAVTAARLPEGACYAWVACESSEAKLIRAALLSRGVDPSALKASGYWRRDLVATHEVHE